MLMTEDEARQREFETVVYRVREELEALCRRAFPGDVERQHDTMQRIMLKMWRCYCREGVQGQWQQWVYRMAKQEVINMYRSKDYWREGLTTPLSQTRAISATDLPEPIDEDSRLALLEALLARLPYEERDLLEQHLDRVPHSEIARQLGCSRSYVQKQLRRITNRLKAMYEEGRLATGTADHGRK